jgi:hypothetical protein
MAGRAVFVGGVADRQAPATRGSLHGLQRSFPPASAATLAPPPAAPTLPSATLLRHLGATPRPGAPDGAFVVLFQLCERARQANAVLYKVTNLPQACSASAMS